MKALGIACAGMLMSFVLIDAMWDGLVAKKIHRDHFGDLMLATANFAAAVIFYVFFAGGIVALAVRSGLQASAVWTAVGYGALLGLAAYGTYDMTNLSTLNGWPLSMSIVDLIGGRVLTGAASAGGYLFARHFG